MGQKGCGELSLQGAVHLIDLPDVADDMINGIQCGALASNVWSMDIFVLHRHQECRARGGDTGEELGVIQHDTACQQHSSRVGHTLTGYALARLHATDSNTACMAP